MAENTIPWWRKALSIALEGIRTGFGLFARPPLKAEAEAAEEARPVAPSAASEPARALDAAALYELSRAKKHKTNRERQRDFRLKPVNAGRSAAEAAPAHLPEPIAAPIPVQAAEPTEPATEPEAEPVPEVAPAPEAIECAVGEAVEQEETALPAVPSAVPATPPERAMEEALPPEPEPEPEPETEPQVELETQPAQAEEVLAVPAAEVVQAEPTEPEAAEQVNQEPEAEPEPVPVPEIEDEMELETAAEPEPEADELLKAAPEESAAVEELTAEVAPSAPSQEASEPEPAQAPVEDFVEDLPVAVEKLPAPAGIEPAEPWEAAAADEPESVIESAPETVTTGEAAATAEAPPQPAAEVEPEAQAECNVPVPLANVYLAAFQTPSAQVPDTPRAGIDEPRTAAEPAETPFQPVEEVGGEPAAELAAAAGEEPAAEPSQEPASNPDELSTAEPLPEPDIAVPALERMEEMEVSPNLMPVAEAAAEVRQEPAVEPTSDEAVPVQPEPAAAESVAAEAEAVPVASAEQDDAAALPAHEAALSETPAEQEAPVAESAEAAATMEEPVEPSPVEDPAAEALPELPVPEAVNEAAPAQPAPTLPEELPEDAEPTPAPAAEAKPAHPMIHREVTDDMPFALTVNNVYDGPLDLLLDLIRKQDIDIYDIPIARITQQFLAYVNQLKSTDVDTAGEFIYMASLLIHIKSKMLLPRTPTGQDDAAEDPRRELVERLLEHERFKNAAQMLLEKQMLEAATWTNPGAREFRNDDTTETEIAADTTDLVRIFRDILDRARNRPVINVEEDSVTVGQMIQFLARRLTMEDKPVALRRLLSHTRSERALIAMFLALLELVRLQAILLRQDSAFSDIFIKKHTGFDAVMDQGTANMHDDWR